MRDTGGRCSILEGPRREAELAVLIAADFPSVLLEVGFLSNDADRERLTTPQGCAPIDGGGDAGGGPWVLEEGDWRIDPSRSCGDRP